MSLVLAALARHCATAPAALAAIAAALPADPDDRTGLDHITAAALIANPATPDHAAETARFTAEVADDLHLALRSRTMPPARVQRLLDDVSDHELADYVTRAHAHPAAVAAFAATHLPPAARANLGDAATLVGHPGATTQTRLHAARILLSFNHPAARDAVVEATRHPADVIADLATVARNEAFAWDLNRYADLARCGTDPHAACLADLTALAGTGDPYARWTLLTDPATDPTTVAAHLLTWAGTREGVDHDLLRAVAWAPHLAGTPAAVTAQLTWYLNRPAPRVVTDADDALRVLLAEPTDLFRTFPFDLVHDATDPAVLDAIAAAPPTSIGWLPAIVCLQVIAHPATGPDTRRTARDALARRVDGSDAATEMLAIAAAGVRLSEDPTALTDVPLTALVRDWTPRRAGAGILDRALGAALDTVTPALADPSTAHAFVALAPTFPGTLREALDAARTITA